MPEAFAGARVERYNAVGEEILSKMAPTGKIRFRRTGSDIGNPANFIQGHSCPGVGRIRFHGIPGFISEFTGMRYGVESPELASARGVKAPNIFFESWDNEDVLENGW